MQITTNTKNVFALSGFESTFTLRKNKQAPYPFNDKNVSYHYNARAALWQGLHALNLKPGDGVLVPNYSCGSEIDVLIKYGLELHWYAIDECLMIDFDALDTRFSGEIKQNNIKALFIINYFGFSQNMKLLRPWLDQHELYLIEDNAHGLYSFDPVTEGALGSFGDISIFSIYKSITLADGGALVINRGDPGKLLNQMQPPLSIHLKSTRELMRRMLMRAFPKTVRFVDNSILGGLAGLLKRKPESPSPEPKEKNSEGFEIEQRQNVDTLGYTEFDSASGCWKMSWYSKLLLKFANHELIAERRRHNYIRLAEKINLDPKIKLIHESLADVCVPLFFPLLQLEGGRALREALLRNGVHCHGFGFSHKAIPSEGFDLENEYKYSLFFIPVNQSLTDDDIDYVASIINTWTETYGTNGKEAA